MRQGKKLEAAWNNPVVSRSGSYQSCLVGISYLNWVTEFGQEKHPLYIQVLQGFINNLVKHKRSTVHTHPLQPLCVYSAGIFAFTCRYVLISEAQLLLLQL